MLHCLITFYIVDRSNVPHYNAYIYIPVYAFVHDNLPIHVLSEKGDKLDTREQSCLGACQDRYLETRTRIQEALERRQASGM